jgi:hypothetical protein
MRIDIEEIERLVALRNHINRNNITDIEWYKNGKKLNLSPDTLDFFKYSGMTVASLAEFYFLEEESEQKD